jgi:murein DD-endopeptidase MepM/ murein hydrolase activator NlpD
MQLIWLSGPTAKVVSFSIGRKTILITVAVLAAALFAFGSIVQLLGIRIAIDAHPDLARSLGGVTSIGEQERIAQHYEQQIAQLREKIDGLVGVVQQLETSKKAIVDLLPTQAAPAARGGGQGGPLRRLIQFEWFAPRATDGLSKLETDALRMESHVNQLLQVWAQEKYILDALPLRAPIHAEYHQSSGFGFRRDPFGFGWARHEGLDFVAAHGAGIHASAGGQVTHAEALGPYGITVDIDHGRGFSTRYAHLSKTDVAAGDTVQAGQLIGRLGSTGRSTGPHLHYEVRVNGTPIDPLVESVVKAARAQTVAGAGVRINQSSSTQ